MKGDKWVCLVKKDISVTLFTGKKRPKDWYKYLFEVAKAKYTGGNLKAAYRKYEIYCDMENLPKFPYERFMEILNILDKLWKEITEF